MWLRRGHWASGAGGGGWESASWRPDYILVIAEQWTQLTPPQVCDNLLCAVGNQYRLLLSYFFNMSVLPWPLHLLPISLFAITRDPYHPARIRINPTSIANLCQQIISHFLDILTLLYGICLIYILINNYAFYVLWSLSEHFTGSVNKSLLKWLGDQH